jgi:hypothetical protein
MYLFNFTINNSEYKFTSTNERIGDYLPMAIKLDKLDNDIHKKKLRIQVPYFKEPFNLINQDIIDYKQTVIIYNEDEIQLYKGYIMEITTNYTTGIADIICGDLIEIMSQGKFPYEFYSRRCRFQLGDENCQATGISQTISDYVIIDNSRIQLNSFNGSITDFIKGYVFFANYPARNISAVDEGNNIIILDRPLAGTDFNSFQIRKGCDKTYATCAGKFWNAHNFGGFLDIPDNNPITGSI